MFTPSHSTFDFRNIGLDQDPVLSGGSDPIPHPFVWKDIKAEYLYNYALFSSEINDKLTFLTGLTEEKKVK